MLGWWGGNCPKRGGLWLRLWLIIMTFFGWCSVKLSENLRFVVLPTTFSIFESVDVWGQYVSFMSDHHPFHHRVNIFFSLKKWMLKTTLTALRASFSAISLLRSDPTCIYIGFTWIDAVVDRGNVFGCIWQSRTWHFQVPSFGEKTSRTIHRWEPNRSMWKRSNTCRQRNTNHMLAKLPRHVLAWHDRLRTHQALLAHVGYEPGVV